MDVTTLYALTRGGGTLQTCWMSWLCTHWPEGVGSVRHPGCYDFVRTDQRGWDLLDVMDVTIWYALTRGGGIFRLPGCYDFVRTDQRGRDPSDLLDVTIWYALTRKGRDLLNVMDVTIWYALTRGVGSVRHPGCYDFVRADQRGWDPSDLLDVMTLYALTRKGWDLLDCLDVMTLYALSRGGGIF